MLELAKSVYHWLGSGAGAASILVAGIALIGAIAGTITSYLVAGRSVYINSITAERSKWIDKLRANIANYSAIIAQLSFRLHEQEGMEGGSIGAESVLKRLDEINNVVSVIQLQLNPWGEIDRNILLLLENVVVRGVGDYRLLADADRLLIAHSQWLLKAEWEKVKYEARGPIYRWWHNRDAENWLNQYRIWVTGEGALDDLIAGLKIVRGRR